MRVTPTAVNSAVSTGCFHDVGTNDIAAEVVDLVGLRLLERVDQRELVEQVGLDELSRSRRCSMRSKFSVLERRTMPKTS